jgi:MinD-like ATPase involved in chromosome partitioning or flagellar assembly
LRGGTELVVACSGAPGAPFTQGLGGLLRGEIPLEEALVATNRPNLALLPARRVDLVSRPVYARSKELAEVIDALAERYDYVLLDVPALQATSDSHASGDAR